MGQDAATLEPVLPDDVTVLHGMIRELLAELHAKTRTLEGVQQRLDQLLRRLYGPKAERFDPNQPTLFDAFPPPEPATPPTPPPEADEEVDPKKKKRKGHGRKGLPDHLKRVRQEHDLPEAEKRCPCCQELRTKIGEETSEQLDFKPATMFVWQHVRFRYACLKCLQNTEGSATNSTRASTSPPPAAETAATDEPLDPSTHAHSIPSESIDVASLIVTAPKPTQPIDKGLPGPGLLAHVITSKYADHLPLHRQEAIFARHGVELSRKTMCDWMAAAAGLLRPLYDLMLTLVLQSRVIQLDETRLPVQDQKDKTKGGRLWAYIGDRNHPYVLYDYRPDKSRAGPDEILRHYSGFLQADAANVFDGLYRPGGIVEVGCWAHARRYFFDAKASDPARSTEALARIGQFYAVERAATAEIANRELDAEAGDALRLRMRQELTVPKLEAFHAWILEQQKIVLPKSPMGQAIQYALNHWHALLRFTTQGFLNIDNNAAERGLRVVAVGRKNYLFVGSDAGGRTAAVLYTMTQSCKRHGVDPFAYLSDVLARLPNTPADHLDQLLPDRWAAARPAAPQ